MITPFSFYADFGPLNLAMLYKYCVMLNAVLKVVIQPYLVCLFIACRTPATKGNRSTMFAEWTIKSEQTLRILLGPFL
jgi:hypothetical protein